MSDINDWITTSAGGHLTGYSQAYVRLLARNGRLPARKIGRDWLVSKSALLAYKQQMEELGPSKHNPHRDPVRWLTETEQSLLPKSYEADCAIHHGGVWVYALSHPSEQDRVGLNSAQPITDEDGLYIVLQT